MDVQERAVGPEGLAVDSAIYRPTPSAANATTRCDRGGPLLHEVTHDQTTPPRPRPNRRRDGVHLACRHDGTPCDCRAGQLLAERVGESIKQPESIEQRDDLAIGVAFLTAE